MADPRKITRNPSIKGGFVPTVRLNPSRVNDMRAQTGPRLVMRMKIRSSGGAVGRTSTGNRWFGRRRINN